jgi:hypothetical protein
MKSTRITNMLAAALVGALAFGDPASAQENPDKQTVADAYVYLLGRALAIRQEQTDLKEPGIAYNAIKYNPVGSANFVNPNLDVAYLEAWIAVDDQTPVSRRAVPGTTCSARDRPLPRTPPSLASCPIYWRIIAEAEFSHGLDPNRTFLGFFWSCSHGAILRIVSSSIRATRAALRLPLANGLAHRG